MDLNSKLRTRIIILNYKGKELLPKCLPSIVEAAAYVSSPTTVTVLNNPSGSEDDGLDYVAKNHPQVSVWKSPKNEILCSYNDYLPLIEEDIVILLNNDIRVGKSFVEPLLEPFYEDPNTFLVAPKTYDFEGDHVEAGPSRAGVRFGLFWCRANYSGYEADIDKEGETFSSGFGAFSREKFLNLGGYRDCYHPGIMEDVDLCYRAKRAGYKLYYAPRSSVYHMGQVSFKSSYGSFETLALAHRNTFLFMWKNFSGYKFWFSHLFWMPLRLAFAVISGQKAFLVGFFRALMRMKQI